MKRTDLTMHHGALENYNWNKKDAQIFWSYIAPCEHVVQLYENEEELLEVLLNFTAGGIRAGESTIIIATSAHLSALNERLARAGFDPFYLQLKDKYIPVSAEETLDKFTIGKTLDEKLFYHVATELLVAAKRHGTPIRAFGEMVAILWQRGQQDAALELEGLWNKFLEQQQLTLLCAYPKEFFKDGNDGLAGVCRHHSRMVAPANARPSNDILFATTGNCGASYRV